MADPIQAHLVPFRLLEQAGAKLHAQDSGDGIVDARLLDDTGAGVLQGVGEKGAPVLGDHHHVDAGVDGGSAGIVAATGQLPMAFPVTDDETVETHAALQHCGEQVAVAVHLVAAPTAEGCHDGLRTRGQCGEIARAVRFAQGPLIRWHIAPVLAIQGTAVAKKVLCGRHNPARTEPLLVGSTLQAANQSRSQAGDNLRVFGVTFVRAAPTVVPGHCQGRCEGPVDTRGRRFPGCNRADSLHQLDVVGGPQANVVGKQGGADQVVVAVDGVCSPDHGYARSPPAVVGGSPVIGVGEGDPSAGGRVRIVVGPGTAAVEHGTEVVTANVFRACVSDLRLHHLAEFFLQGHRFQQGGNAGFHSRLHGNGAFDHRPLLGVEAQVHICLRRLAHSQESRNRKGENQAPAR